MLGPDHIVAAIDELIANNGLIPLSSERESVPTDRVVMYVGAGTPADWPIADAVVGCLFTSTDGAGLWHKDSDWDLVGGADVDTYTKDEANEIANQLDASLREYTKFEAASAVEDANLYTDQQIAALPDPPEAPDLSYLDELQNLAVVGNYKLIHTGDLEPGAITGRKDGNVADNLTHRWTEMWITLQDLNSYVSNNFLNVQQGWIVEFHSKKGDEVIAAKWRITGEVVRNGDRDIEFDIEAINDDSLQFDLREHTAGELYVHDGSKTPHFPVRTSRFDQLVARVEALEKRLKEQ